MRRNGIGSKKERITMAVSSAFVLAALTMTGIYMNRDNKAAIDKGYTVDFGALEKSADEKFNQIAQSRQKAEKNKNDTALSGAATDNAAGKAGSAQDAQDKLALNNAADSILEGLPMGSAAQTVPEAQAQAAVDLAQADDMAQMGNTPSEDNTALEDNTTLAENALPGPEAPAQAVLGAKVAVERELHFTKEGAHVPIYGDVLMAYNMEETVYFKTLQQYRRNPAVLYAAQPDVEVFACADAKVVKLAWDAKLGNTLVLDLGDGYLATYGQLKDIQVSAGSYVEAGQVIAAVDNPTRYYSEEGCNLYFELRKDGAAVNPEGFGLTGK